MRRKSVLLTANPTWAGVFLEGADVGSERVKISQTFKLKEM